MVPTWLTMGSKLDGDEEDETLLVKAKLAAPYAAEFIGTFLITLTILVNTGPFSLEADWKISSNAFMVIAVTSAISTVSGSMLNPSVSLALYFCGRLHLKSAIYFSIVQILGALLAVLSMFLFTNRVPFDDSGPREGHSALDACIVEVLYTAFLVFVYLNCVASRSNNCHRKTPHGTDGRNGFYALAIGFCYISAGYAAMSIYTTGLNPAINIALHVSLYKMHGKFFTYWHPLLGVCDLIAVGLAVFMYWLVRPEDFQRSQEVLPPPNSSQDPSIRVDSGPMASQDVVTRDRVYGVNVRSISAEMIGTFFVVFTKAMNTMNNQIVVSKKQGPDAWSVAASTCAMAFCLRGVSGAHFNPAITLSVWLSGIIRFSFLRALAYMCAQFLMGIAASMLALYLSHISGTAEAKFWVNPNNQFMLYSLKAEMLAEVGFTFLVSYMVLTLSTKGVVKSDQGITRNYAGFAQGACITAAGFSVEQVSGSILNPAATLGMRLAKHSAGYHLHHCWFEAFEQFLGAGLAAICFIATNPKYYLSPKADVKTL